MAESAIQFGAGNIGRGFLAQLFHESGLEVVFVDVAPAVIDAINTRKGYGISIVGDDPQRVHIDRIRALNSSEVDAVAREVAQASIVCTAVGAAALPLTAPAIALGLEARHRAGGEPLNILLCENLHNAAEVLRRSVSALLPESSKDAILAQTGFVQAVVSRMVPLQTPEDRSSDPLGVRVEAYKRLPVDASAWVGPTPAGQFVGFEAVSPFQAYVDRKLFTHNCAHAVLGYYGYMASHKYGYEALHDAAILCELMSVLAETGSALVKKHGFDSAEHERHVTDLLHRFDNRFLGDTCIRLARDPIRKLAPGDRIVGAARCCESQGVEPRALARAINAALQFDDPTDPPAVELQRMMKSAGRASTIETICGIKPGDRLAELIERP